MLLGSMSLARQDVDSSSSVALLAGKDCGSFSCPNVILKSPSSFSLGARPSFRIIELDLLVCRRRGRGRLVIVCVADSSALGKSREARGIRR